MKRFDGKKADTALPVKLREELPGVLAWAVRGCVEWVEHGLGSAKAVESATAEYRAETDILEQFFGDRCYFYPEGKVTRTELYKAWEEWCDEMGEHAGSQNSFTRTVRERGVVKGFKEAPLHGNVRGWHGISLENTPEKSPSGKSATPQNPSKRKGRESEGLHFSPENENFSTDTASYRGFSENEEKVQPEEKSATTASRPPSEDDYLSGPQTFKEDGLTIEYMPERSE